MPHSVPSPFLRSLFMNETKMKHNVNVCTQRLHDFNDL